ncbi:hypothetical protein JXO52_07510 [bacterium]|nr:hypothetical protein [bacterium]
MKHTGRRTLAALMVFLLVCRCEMMAVIIDRLEEARSHEPLNVLFIGSSYFTANNLPSLFRNCALSGGKQVETGAAMINGVYLDYHASAPLTTEVINSRLWDYVVLQGVCTNVAYPDVYTEHPVLPAITQLKATIRANCDSTKIIFCMPWAFEDGMTWKPGWTDTYVDMQKKIYDNTLAIASEADVIIAPVGWAWNRVLKELGYPLHYLHLQDWNHPTAHGSYLMAAVLYTTIFRESAEPLLHSATIPGEEAQYLRRIASDIVLENLELWRIND